MSGTQKFAEKKVSTKSVSSKAADQRPYEKGSGGAKMRPVACSPFVGFPARASEETIKGSMECLALDPSNPRGPGENARCRVRAYDFPAC
jgi:hypothetical protein